MLAFPCTTLTVRRTGGWHVAAVANKVAGEIFAEKFGHDLQFLFEVFVEGFTAFDTVHKKSRGRLRSGENRPLKRHPRMVGPHLEPATGLTPATFPFRVGRSAIELRE